MQKDELIQFYMFLLQLKNHLEEMVDNNDELVFQFYDKLDVTPYQVHKSKIEQELVIFLLSRRIVDLLSYNNFLDLEKVSDRLDQMSERFITEKEKRFMLYFKDEISVNYLYFDLMYIRMIPQIKGNIFI